MPSIVMKPQLDLEPWQWLSLSWNSWVTVESVGALPSTAMVLNVQVSSDFGIVTMYVNKYVSDIVNADYIYRMSNTS